MHNYIIQTSINTAIRHYLGVMFVTYKQFYKVLNTPKINKIQDLSLCTTNLTLFLDY